MKIAWKLLIACLACTYTVYAQAPAPGDLVINEVLFDPPTGGYDYVEVCNPGTRTIDLRELVIASRNSTGDLDNRKGIARDTLYLPPGGFLVVTKNARWLQQHYQVPSGAIVCEISSLPSLPNDTGTVILLNKEDAVIDELSYSATWQFALISNPSGVALERISPKRPTQDKNNWVSASSASGYGTPGKQNSQFLEPAFSKGEVIVPRMFSPDNDGVNDMALLQFQLGDPGSVVNTIIYDLSGRKVRHLLKNELPGVTAVYTWDGLDDRSMPLSEGIYIIVTEIYTLKGKTKSIKNAVMLVRR